MADIERLVVQMSADFKSFERELARASGVTKEQLRQIRQEATSAGDGASSGFDGASKGVERFGRASRAAQSNVRALTAQTGNLAAQFQDIGVQLAGGTSPLTVALQQGTQISAVLGGAGAAGAVKALGGAFASIISPVSLVTIGIIAAGGAAIQYFSSLLSEGEKSEAELKQQGDAIRRLAQEWGEAIPALKAYVDELDRAQQAKDAAAAQETVVGDIWAPARESTQQMAIDFEDLVQKLLALGASTGEVVELQNAFATLEGKVRDGSVQIGDAEAVAAALTALLQSSGIPAVEGFANAFTILANQVAIASSQARIARGDFVALLDASNAFKASEEMRRSALAAPDKSQTAVDAMNKENALTSEQLALQQEIESVKTRVGVIGELEADAQARANIAADARRKAEDEAARKAARSVGGGGGGGGGGGRSAAVSEAERERDAVTKLIEQLQFEQSLISATNLEREKANALRRAGTAATEPQRAQIENLVTAMYAEKEALEAQEDALNNIRGLSSDVLGGMFEDLRDGAEAADVMANALNRVAESFVKAGIDTLITGAFPTGGAPTGGLLGGRIIPGILHSGGVAGVDGYRHGRTVDPSAFIGAKRYHRGGTAGIMPGEVPAILQRGETVLPKGAGAAGRVILELSPDLEARVLTQAARNSVEIVSKSSREQAATFRDRTIGAVRDPRRRGS